MAVLIKGMEMPLPGTFNIIYIYSDGQIHMPSWGKGMTPTNGVKAIPIPPHGRLIDVDALETKVEQDYKRKKITRYDRDLLLHYLDVEMSPTVITASKGK